MSICLICCKPFYNDISCLMKCSCGQGTDVHGSFTCPFKTHNHSASPTDQHTQHSSKQDVQHKLILEKPSTPQKQIRSGIIDDSVLCNFCRTYGHQKSECPKLF